MVNALVADLITPFSECLTALASPGVFRHALGLTGCMLHAWAPPAIELPLVPLPLCCPALPCALA